MSHNLTPASSSPAVSSGGVLVPDAGDARTAASVTTPIQTLLNMVVWLYNVLVGAQAQNVSINGTLTSVGAFSTAASASINSGLDVNAAGSVYAAHDVSAAGTVTGTNLVGTTVMVSSQLNAAAIVGRKLSAGVQGDNADSAFNCGPAGYDQVWVPATGVLTAARTYSVDTTGSRDGSEITFTNLDASHNIYVTVPGTSSPVTNVTINGNVGNPNSVTLRRLNSTTWMAFRAGAN